jgi:hypothetical protein
MADELGVEGRAVSVVCGDVVMGISAQGQALLKHVENELTAVTRVKRQVGPAAGGRVLVKGDLGDRVKAPVSDGLSWLGRSAVDPGFVRRGGRRARHEMLWVALLWCRGLQWG